MPVPLSHCGSGFTGNHTLASAGTYFYQLEGEDTEANPFSFLVPRSVYFGTGMDYYSFDGLGIETVEGVALEFITIPFLFRGDNPYGPTTFQFTVGDLPGFSRRVQPAQVTLRGRGEEEVNVSVLIRTSVSTIQSGSSFTVRVTASNGCATLTASRRLIITVPVSSTP